jgi:alcohol dehydrogenase (cytochrome c)
LNYTREQALSGRAVYGEKCGACHGQNLQGQPAPALRGPAFQKLWMNGDRKVSDLYTKIQQSMPVGAPGSLSGEQYFNLITLILSQNGFRPTTDSLALSDIGKVMTAPPDAVPVSLDPSLPLGPFPQAPIGSGTASTAKPDDAELSRADDAVWLMYNKSYTGQRYSGLDQINVSNATRLVPVCLFQPGEIGAFQSAPVVYDGLMYITTPYNTFAINPATCAKVWENRYAADVSANWSVNRGVALYRGKLFRVTPDGHLIALDAKTGKLLWDVWMVNKSHGYWLSAAPVTHDGMVFMGSAGADWGANGLIEAFDTETGRLRWTFNVIPAGREIGADTWKKGSEKGGGAFWSTFAIDQAKGQLLIPLGNPAPDFMGELRPGDNLFTDSVVALDARTGKLAWWVQQIPHDLHDWDTAAAPVIYDQDHRSYMAVVNKGGWLYIYDRTTRKLVRQSEISPHENVDVPLTKQGVHHCPGTLGGASWNGAAYSPKTKALYVNSVHWCGTTNVLEDRYIEGSTYLDGIPVSDPVSEAKGFTRAFDAATGKELWARRFDYPMLAAITVTSGGVLFTGALNGDFLVLDARNGSTLYRFNSGGAVAGAPSTYLVNGKQYVAIATGNSSRMIWQSGGSMMVALFALREE